MLLEINDVEVHYHKVAALKGVNMAVPDDGIVTIIGANGAGKTTLLTAIMGVLPLKGGTAFPGPDTAALDIEEGASFTGRSEMVPGRKGAAGRLPEAASTAKHGALQREAAASLGPVKDRSTDDGSPEGADVAVPEEEAAAGD